MKRIDQINDLARTVFSGLPVDTVVTADELSSVKGHFIRIFMGGNMASYFAPEVMSLKEVKKGLAFHLKEWREFCAKPQTED